ncbi:MAG: AtpZ/AtpI family protein [Halothiobacillaceae bacterium]|jgi:ATP synthase protein I|nr:MAG: AtpZ/AtpI family protein [Halothiobacillaceae bacterium]
MSNKPSLGLPLMGAGNIFISMIAAGFVLGYVVDGWLDTRPWFMLGLGALGVIGGYQKAHLLLRLQDGSRNKG